MSDPLELATDLIKASEGFRSKPYRDVAGYPTWGYGTLIVKDKAASLPDVDITEQEAARFLHVDALRFYSAVLRLCPVPLSAGQSAALIDFCYNLGAGNLQASTLRQKLLRGDYDGAAAEFIRWNRAAGHTVRGLTARRLAERRLFLTG